MFGKMAGKILTSPKFLQFIADAQLGDLVSEALAIPAIREKLVGSLTELGADLREKYDIESWRWERDRELDTLTAIVNINTTEQRKDFITHFHTFLEDLRKKFGGGFDSFIKIYKVKSISAREVGETVAIVIESPRAADLEGAVLNITTANVDFKGGDDEGNG